MQESKTSDELNYNPFRYPPDYELARVHQIATMPGKPDPKGQICPCCQQRQKVPFKSWWDREIQKDFKSFGGAVVAYFWLLKLYSFSIIAVICVYGAYLQYLTNYYCESQSVQEIKKQVCYKLFGIWVVTNQDLRDLIQNRGHQSTLARFLTLRSVAFLLLLVTNLLSLHIMKWFKVRHPDKINISNFSIIFKNLKNDNLDQLLNKLRKKFGQFKIKEAFIIKKVQPFYTAYQEKLQTYYACKIEKDPKLFNKLIFKLNTLDKFCSENEEYFYNQGNRAIIVFNELQVKEEVLQKYRISNIKMLQMFFNNDYEEQYRTYGEKCPRPEQILWKNIGIIQQQNFKVKILSIFYFLLSLSVIFLFLYFFLEIVYIYTIKQPWKTILQNIICIFVVFIGLSFRMLMGKLSEMRFPNTFSSRTIFIVITTVVFHIIFYLFIPSVYLAFNDTLRGAILAIISNQSINFIIVQITLAGFDLMYCCWNREKVRTENQDKPIGCQKILHQKMQYPRFPIEFKLIILFKIWSLITFFSFHVPLIIFLIFLVLIFLYFKDKMNIYYHYRMQMIDNQVEFKFLRIYSNVFSVYLLLIFLFTQHQPFEYILGGAVTALAIIIQTIYFRKLRINEPSSKDSFVELTLSQLQEVDSYQDRYTKFMDEARNDMVDIQIKQYLSRNGFGTMKTESSQVSQKLM